MNCNAGVLVISSAHSKSVDKAYVRIYLFYV